MAEKTFMSACRENHWHATDHEFSYFPNSFLAYYLCRGPMVSAYVLKFQVLKLQLDLNDRRKHKHESFVVCTF